MLQIEEWFRRPQRRPEKKAASAAHPTAEKKQEENHMKKPVSQQLSQSAQRLPQEQPAAEAVDELTVAPEAPDELGLQSEQDSGGNMPVTQQESLTSVAADREFVDREPEDTSESGSEDRVPEQAADDNEGQEDGRISLQDSVEETDELEHISQKIGSDVSGMIDLEKEDLLLQQIDEFREKAMQLQQLMQSRATKAKELQDVVEEQSAKASELDSLINERRGEADKIMNQVTQRIDAMSVGVRSEMSGLSDAVSKEVGGLTQNLTHEINESTEKTRLAVEAATQNMIDQNTRSLEGLKEQLDQLNHLEQIGELSTEMNSQITTLKTDIVDQIHAEDVKCYRNIQASMDEQSKLLSEADEKTRQHIKEQVDLLGIQMGSQSKLSKASLVISILNIIGIAAIFVFLILF